MKYYIIPEPKTCIEEKGTCYITYNMEIVLNQYCSEREYNYAQILREEIKEQTGLTLRISKGIYHEENAIYLNYTEKEIDDLCSESDIKRKQETYLLKIRKHGVEINAGHESGILYGIQTLRQLIRQAGAALPCMTIEDSPSIPNRGFYHDATRGRVGTLAFYKELADCLSYYKINQMQLYVEHTYCFRRFSEVWRDDTPLTAQDILELDQYCSELCIDLVPSIATFGHLYKLLSTKSYAHLCELPDSDKATFSFSDRMRHHTINATDKESLSVIFELLDEYIPLFRSNLFNICADETFDLGKGKSREKAEEIGVHHLYVDFVKELCNHVKTKGKRPMFWGDVIVGAPELIKELPEDVICLNWGYAEEEKEDATNKLFSVGATQYLCPGVHGWNHLMNRLDAAYLNISRMCSYAMKYQALGVLNTDWGDFGHIASPVLSIPGMIYGAAFSWSGNILRQEEINRQISVVQYGDNSGTFLDFVTELSRQESFQWYYIVRFMEDAAERNVLFDTLELFDVSAKNERIQELTNDLYQLAVKISSSQKYILRHYLIVAKGQMLFNTVGGVIRARRLGTPVSDSPKALAEELEVWFRDYKELWREVSRESELYRLQNVIFWYCDYLRDLK